MKRIFTFGLMLTALFALTNCTEELIDTTISTDEVTQETTTPETACVPFQVQASFAAETKTVGAIGQDSNGKAVLKTNWSSGDQINVFFAEIDNTGKQGSLINAGLFKVSDTENGIFSGFLPNDKISDSKVYNWYFVYDATGASIAKDNATAQITIGSAEQEQVSTNGTSEDVAHIGAANCPMWGTAKNVSGSVYPRVQMNHLAALYEITIQNKTKANSVSGAQAGSILVKDVGIRVSSTGTWLSKDNTAKQKALVGSFTLDILNGSISQVADNKNYSVKLNITENPLSSIIVSSEKKYYLVTAPVDIQTERTTDPLWYEAISNPKILKTATEYGKLTDDEKELYRAATKRIDTFTFTVNGAERAVGAIEDFNIDARSGKTYKFTIPIHEITHPLVSDILGMKANLVSGNNKPDILSFTSQNNPLTANINGHSGAQVYTISEGDVLTIDGTTKDLIKALDIGFFATSWQGQRAAMTISRINMWFPEFNNSEVKGHTQFAVSQEIEDGMIAVLKSNFGIGSTTAWLAWKALGWIFTKDMKDGLYRDSGTISISSLIDPQTLTFNGLIENGSNSSDKNIIILSESVAHKQVTGQTIQTLLEEKFTYTLTQDHIDNKGYGALGADGDEIKPSYQGLLNIINGEATNEGHKTAVAIYERLLEALETKTFPFGEYEIKVGALITAIFPDVATFKLKIPHMRFQIDIIPFPYDPDKSAYGSKGNPITPNLPINPIVVWGLDALGPNVSPNVN